MTPEISELEQLTGLQFTDYQVEALERALLMQQPAPKRCLYYKTGAGKSYTALAMMKLWGQSTVLVIAPPSTHPAWSVAGAKFKIGVRCISHAKFRQKDFKVARDQAVIADEMHLFGGHEGKGWKKLDRLAAGMKAPMVLASATPNYNDAERVYCIQHVLDPLSCRGGFLQFLYAHCTTEANPYAMMPNVTGFQRHADAAEYLASLKQVDYLPDDLVYDIKDIELYAPPSAVMQTYGYVESKHRMIASIIEEKHTRILEGLVSDTGVLDLGAQQILERLLDAATGPVLIFSNHSTVAEACWRWLFDQDIQTALVTGSTPTKAKAETIAEFNAGLIPVLVGTASLATGTDGMDKVCDQLIILDDTEDDSLRRQLVGRIMPRGIDGGDASNKQVHRIVLTP